VKTKERCPRCKGQNIKWQLQDRECLDCGCFTIKEDFISRENEVIENVERMLELKKAQAKFEGRVAGSESMSNAENPYIVSKSRLDGVKGIGG
jgi:hypothetical protein